MPTPRSPATVILAAILICLTAGPPHRTASATDATLPLLTGPGKAPAAALLPRERSTPPPRPSAPAVNPPSQGLNNPVGQGP
ncbi:hypothetical protein [Streptomyces sp. 135]|uniref:hypothetical protein n=1 Tax=Streptomyces sp. 135 TaxID=2838850 RepID=UPI001CBABAEC|nr:hypothetical protein [Streptomyces sp. 135]